MVGRGNAALLVLQARSMEGCSPGPAPHQPLRHRGSQGYNVAFARNIAIFQIYLGKAASGVNYNRLLVKQQVPEVVIP